MDSTFDKMFYSHGELIAGIDETGVSDIAGPLVAACVILPRIDLHMDDLRIFEVQDSKVIPERKRKYYAEIIWQTAMAIGIGTVTPAEIDYFGRHTSTKLAMYRAVMACKKTTTKEKVVPDLLLIDGNIHLPSGIPTETIAQGDVKSLSIASASVIAKVFRDEEMIKLHYKHPYYDWENNKGFPCKKHFEGIDKNGIIIGIHRINTWPLSMNSKYRSDRVNWRQRRCTWKSQTANIIFAGEHESSRVEKSTT